MRLGLCKFFYRLQRSCNYTCRKVRVQCNSLYQVNTPDSSAARLPSGQSRLRWLAAHFKRQNFTTSTRNSHLPGCKILSRHFQPIILMNSAYFAKFNYEIIQIFCNTGRWMNTWVLLIVIPMWLSVRHGCGSTYMHTCWQCQ